MSYSFFWASTIRKQSTTWLAQHAYLSNCDKTFLVSCAMTGSNHIHSFSSCFFCPFLLRHIFCMSRQYLPQIFLARIFHADLKTFQLGTAIPRSYISQRTSHAGSQTFTTPETVGFRHFHDPSTMVSRQGRPKDQSTKWHSLTGGRIWQHHSK